MPIGTLTLGTIVLDPSADPTFGIAFRTVLLAFNLEISYRTGTNRCILQPILPLTGLTVFLPSQTALTPKFALSTVPLVVLVEISLHTTIQKKIFT